MTSNRFLGPRVSLVLVCMALASCAPSEDRAAEPTARPVVAVPLAPLAGIVDALAPAGEVEVVVLIPRGANPATYEPKLGDLRRADGARLYLEIAHPAFVFEGTWLAGLLDGGSTERVPLFADCPSMRDDEHVWTSAVCLEAAATKAASALGRILADRGAEIDANLREFRLRLAEADSVARIRLAPYRGRSFLVLHPAWGYLAREHGLTQIEILSHGTGDPGPSRLRDVIETGRAEGVSVVYVQPQFNQAPAQLVAAELGADLVSLDPLERDPVEVIRSAAAALEAGFQSEGMP